MGGHQIPSVYTALRLDPEDEAVSFSIPLRHRRPALTKRLQQSKPDMMLFCVHDGDFIFCYHGLGMNVGLFCAATIADIIVTK